MRKPSFRLEKMFLMADVLMSNCQKIMSISKEKGIRDSNQVVFEASALLLL